ncbi:MAG: hypothetical protein HUU47_08020 [Bacteroidetes bacterium]|nr:hypothetical protein [Bacteroidota bacterium]
MKIKVIIAAVLGGITSFITGFLTYNLLLGEFFKSNVTNASANNPPIAWALFASNLGWGFFFVIIFNRWASISTFKSGMINGLWMGLLLGLSINLMNYSLMGGETILAHAVDVILWGIICAAGGGVGGWALGFGNKSSE